MNDLDKNVLIKRSAFTVNEFLDMKHLDNALKIRASYHVTDVLAKLKGSTMKKKVKMNDLFAKDLIDTARAHMMYMSFVIYMREVEKTEFKD